MKKTLLLINLFLSATSAPNSGCLNHRFDLILMVSRVATSDFVLGDVFCLFSVMYRIKLNYILDINSPIKFFCP